MKKMSFTLIMFLIICACNGHYTSKKCDISSFGRVYDFNSTEYINYIPSISYGMYIKNSYFSIYFYEDNLLDEFDSSMIEEIKQNQQSYLLKIKFRGKKKYCYNGMQSIIIDKYRYLGSKKMSTDEIMRYRENQLGLQQ